MLLIKRKKFLLILITTALFAALGGGLTGGLTVATLTNRAQFAASQTPSVIPSAEPENNEPHPVNLTLTDISTTITDSVQTISPSVVTLVSSFSEISGSTETIVILSDGKELPAEIIGMDRFSDLAVLQVDADLEGKAAVLGNSDQLNPGELAIAIGSPLGKFKNTVTVGGISATDRMLRVNENYQMEGLIQTDAAINQGNSGGPLVNLSGEVIGINTLIVQGGSSTRAEGLGFAIPANVARLIAAQVINEGVVSRPFPGIRWEWITPEIAKAYGLPTEWGAFVSYVLPDTPADRAGLQRGDIITKFGNRKLNESNPFINALYDFKPSDVVLLTVQRGERILDIEITLAVQPG